jgi:hypothetical protein
MNEEEVRRAAIALYDRYTHEGMRLRKPGPRRSNS